MHLPCLSAGNLLEQRQPRSRRVGIRKLAEPGTGRRVMRDASGVRRAGVRSLHSRTCWPRSNVAANSRVKWPTHEQTGTTGASGSKAAS
ncbi:hypothetical protein [Acetobacter okinawensis]|uniref:hypothetical protein n=1 Tax=Acetobacter okinawensis TaxID=1076594 RepID=UPI0039ED464B